MITIKINTDGAAFDGFDCVTEIMRLLEIASRKVEIRLDKDEPFKSQLNDINGNPVGIITYKP